jgi:hypothetical protein
MGKRRRGDWLLKEWLLIGILAGCEEIGEN